MKRYLQYRVEDFVWDSAFRQWVLFPTRETDARWQQWQAQHPDKANLIQEAREVVLSLQLREIPISEQEINYAVQRTLGRARKTAQPGNETDISTPIIPLYRQPWVWLAASLLLFSGLGWWSWSTQFATKIARRHPSIVSYDGLIATQKQTLTETENRSTRAMPVKLSDGSLVILHPGSRMSYKVAFTGNTREVFLSGEAFFEITKNPNKPFLIFANGLVTKVLGTSFLIRAYPKESDVTVEVKTGRVAVFAMNDPAISQKVSDRELEGVVLTPNQKIVFEREQVRLAKSLVENPQVLPGASAANRFAFDDTPLPRVFDTLERAYGVDIVFDEELLANCPLTAELTDQPLFEKLDVICRVIEARYEVMDGQIIIYSRGCKP